MRGSKKQITELDGDLAALRQDERGPPKSKTLSREIGARVESASAVAATAISPSVQNNSRSTFHRGDPLFIEPSEGRRRGGRRLPRSLGGGARKNRAPSGRAHSSSHVRHRVFRQSISLRLRSNPATLGTSTLIHMSYFADEPPRSEAHEAPVPGLRSVSAPRPKSPSADNSLAPGKNICADCERLIV